MKRFVAILLIGVFPLLGQTKVDYGTQVKNGPIFSDASYISLAAACAAANNGAGPVSVTKTWAMNTQEVSCNLVFNGGMLRPAGGQLVTITGSFNCPAFQQCIDPTAGGKVAFSTTATTSELGFDSWGAKGNASTNDYVAAQAAVDALCGYTSGGASALSRPVYMPRQYLLGSTLNLTTANRSSGIVRDGCHLVGSMYGVAASGGSLIGASGAGFAIFETTGSQGVVLENITWTNQVGSSTVSNASTVGMYTGITASNPQSQNLHLINTTCSMATSTSSNSGLGSICLWNFGSEEHTYDTMHWTADLPVLLTAYHATPATYGNSYEEGDLLASHSLGLTTFTGECFATTWTRFGPAFESVDVNTVDAQNLYMATLNQASGTNNIAMAVYGSTNNLRWHGLVEGFGTPLAVFGAVEWSDIKVTVGAVADTTGPYITIDRGEGFIDSSKVSIVESISGYTKPLFGVNPSGPQDILGSYISNSHFTANLGAAYLTIPENLLFNSSTSNVTVDGLAGYHYEVPRYGKFRLTVPTTTIKTAGGSDNSGYIGQIVWPSTASGTGFSAGNITVHVVGSIGIGGGVTNSQSGLKVDLVGTLVSATSGAITAPASLTSTIPYGLAENLNTAGNTLSDMGVIFATTCPSLPSATACTTSLIAVPVQSGANSDATTFTGTIEIDWSGWTSRAPSLAALSGPVTGSSYTAPVTFWHQINYFASETGSNNAIAITGAPPGIGAAGSCLLIQLAHTLASGSGNTLTVNGGTPALISSHLNPVNGLTTGYASTGLINLCVGAGRFLDMSQ